MQKKKNIVLLLAMSFAILAFSADRVLAQCTQSEMDNYECSEDAQSFFEVRVIKPFPLIEPCNVGELEPCSIYRYQVTQLGSYSARSVNLIVERPFEDLIVDGGLDCDGSGDPATWFAKYLTWNCYYQWNDENSGVFTLELKVRGGTSSAPSDWFITRGNDTAWGIILAPALVARPEVIAQTAEEFTYINAEGRTYTVKVNKDLAGNIISIKRTDPDGNVEDITNSGIPIDLFQISYDGGITFEPLKFIPNTVIKTGEASTCAYFYNGYYYNFCY